MGGSHRDEFDGADLVHVYWIISEIRVKITRPWLCSSEGDRLRGKSDDTNPLRISRNISEIRGKIAQPWRGSSIGERHRDESKTRQDLFWVAEKYNTNISSKELFNRWCMSYHTSVEQRVDTFERLGGNDLGAKRLVTETSRGRNIN